MKSTIWLGSDYFTVYKYMLLTKANYSLMNLSVIFLGLFFLTQLMLLSSIK